MDFITVLPIDKSVTITKTEAMKLVRKWECLPFFPKTVEGIGSLTEAFVDIVGTVDNAEWMGKRVVNGFSRCPTPIELRRYFSHHRGAPADGIHERDYDASDFLVGLGKGKD